METERERAVEFVCVCLYLHGPEGHPVPLHGARWRVAAKRMSKRKAFCYLLPLAARALALPLLRLGLALRLELGDAREPPFFVFLFVLFCVCLECVRVCVSKCWCS